MRPPRYYNHHTAAFGKAIFGLAHLGSEYYDFMIGLEARKSIARIRTFRIRHGNGEYGSVPGRIYQDQMKYYTPANPQTAPQQEWRDTFSDGVVEALALTEEQKQPYKNRAKEVRGQTWFTIFMSDYLIV